MERTSSRCTARNRATICSPEHTGICSQAVVSDASSETSKDTHLIVEEGHVKGEDVPGDRSRSRRIRITFPLWRPEKEIEGHLSVLRRRHLTAESLHHAAHQLAREHVVVDDEDAQRTVGELETLCGGRSGRRGGRSGGGGEVGDVVGAEERAGALQNGESGRREGRGEGRELTVAREDWSGRGAGEAVVGRNELDLGRRPALLVDLVEWSVALSTPQTGKEAVLGRR